MNDSPVVTPPRSAAYVLADQAVDGHLPDLLKSWRDQGLSYGAIARELVMRGAVVSDEGVRSWCQRLLVEASV